MKIIKRPILTEKTIRLIRKRNQYIFDVRYQLTKPEICRLIEAIFLTQVAAVNTYLLPKRKRRRGGMKGFLANRKRSFITLEGEEKIAFFPKSSLILFLLVYGFAYFLFYKSWKSPYNSGLFLGNYSQQT